MAEIDYLVVLNTEADRMSEATRTQETFNAATKEVCNTFDIENSLKSNIDLFSDWERCLYLIACNGIANHALLKQINSLYHR